MAKGFANLGILQQKDAGHALDIAGGEAYEVSAERRTEGPQNTFGIQILAKLGADQAELLIEAPLRIAEARNVEQTVGREKPLGFFFGAEMHERQRDVFRFDGGALFGELGDGFTAEGAAKVAKEYQEQRALRGEGRERLAGLRGVAAQERGVDLARSEHVAMAVL